jgi:hypothetical protein
MGTREIKDKILKIYPDIRRFGIGLEVASKGGEGYRLTLDKDTASAGITIGRKEVDACMRDEACSLIRDELAHFVRRFTDEELSVPDAG